jgi:hypothetical protein
VAKLKARFIVEGYRHHRWNQEGRRKFKTINDAFNYMGNGWFRVLETSEWRIRNTKTGEVIYIDKVA